jgi:hypothetical protein
MNGSTSTPCDTAPVPGASFLPKILLGALIVLSVLLIGGVGYVKVNLDRAAAVLAAPDQALNADQELADKTMHALGYGGFLGAAQNWIANRHDATSLQDMQQDLKSAKEALTRAGDKSSASVRHDIEAVLGLYASLLNRAEKANDAGVEGLTPADLLTAATALPTLDARLQTALASTRFAAHADYRSWSFALAALGWMGLVLTALLAAALVQTMGNKETGPLKNLLNSLNHTLDGNMQTPVWGTERHGLVGELARALDRARQKFAQIPDVTLMTDQGPLPLKFDGESRSLFQALTRSLRDDYERSRTTASSYTQMMADQQASLTSLIAKLNDISAQIQKTGALNDASVKTLAKNIADTTRGMAQAQDMAVAQIKKLVPFLSDRARNMAEITGLAGTQVTQSLSTFVEAERKLRTNATQSQQVITQLADTTNQLGERLFAAVNLMQASGKALNEVTEAAQSRFNEAVETLGRGENKLQTIVARAEDRLNKTVNAEENMAALAARTESSAARMETAVRSMSDKHEQLENQTTLASQRMETIVASFDTAQHTLTDAVEQLRHDGDALSSMMHDLRASNDDMIDTVRQNSQTSFTTVQGLTERSQALMQRLEVQIAQQAQAVEGKIDELMLASRNVSQQSQVTTLGLAKTVEALNAEYEKIATTRAQFSDALADLADRLENQTAAAFARTEDMASHSHDQLASLAEQMESVVQKLTILGQLTGTLGSVAGQLGQLVPALTGGVAALPVAAAPIVTNASPTSDVVLPSTEALSAALGDALQESLAAPLVEKIQTELHEALLQIEAMHDQLAQMVVAQKDQLETRLIVMDKKLRDVPASDDSDPRQTALMSDIVTTLAKINDHVMELDEALAQDGDDAREA